MSNRKTTVFYAGLIAVAFTAIGMVIASRLDLAPRSEAQTMVSPAMNSAPVTGPLDAQTFRNIAKAATPSVVNISTESKRRRQEMTDFFGGDDLFRRFFGQPDADQPQRRGGRPRDETVQGAGTGFVINQAKGYILTNNHVVADATRIQVGFFDGEAGDLFDAKVVGRDPLTDSALIQLVQKPTGFAIKEVAIGDATKVAPGDWVMAIGNPFNLAHTVTVGVISATERPFPVADGRSQQVLQTDAAINPGNSGGPLLNLRGEVIGINTAILASQQTSNLGIGFAIPINVVSELLPELEKGKVTRGRVGLSLQTTRISPEAAKAFGLSSRDGAVVTQVTDDTPAARAGFKPGDVILEYNGKAVKDSTDLVAAVVRTKPGTTVPVKIMRDRQAKTLNVTVDELDLEAETQAAPEATGETAGFGMTIDNLTPQAARGLRLPSGMNGALVSDLDPSGAAARAGVQPNDVILEVNRQAVTSASDAIRLLQRVASGEPAFLLVYRRGSELFLTVTKQ